MDHKAISREAVLEAAKLAGSQAALGAAIGAKPAEVSGWVTDGKNWRPVPIPKAIAIENIFGVSRMRLRAKDAASIWPNLASSSKRRTGKATA